MPIKLHITLLILILLFIFQNPIEGFIPVFSYYDELLTVFFSAIAVVFQLHKGIKVKRSTALFLFLTTLILILGLIGNVFNDYQLIQYAIIDAFKVVQFILIFLAVRSIDTNGTKIILAQKIYSAIKGVSVILLLLVILNYLIEIFPTYDERYGLKAQQLFFSHPTYLVSTCILMISVLTISLRANKKNMKYIHILNLVVLTTLRTKAILFILIYYTILFFIANKIKFRWYHYLFITSLVLFIGTSMMYDSLVYNPYYPRTIMMRYSIEISSDHFPFGSGFGTFGSHISGEHYSNLYYLYGDIYRYYGLSPINYTAISDTFWPMLLAQTGVIGTILFTIMLAVLAKLVINIKKHDSYIFISIVVLFLYLIITSTAESSFSNPYATAYFFIIALIINYKNDNLGTNKDSLITAYK